MNPLSTNTDESTDEPKSKSQIKREFKQLQELGRQLVELSDKQLVSLPLSETILELILAAKKLKHGVFNRQIRLIGGRMPAEDVEGIQTGLDRIKQSHKVSVRQFHEVEQWRDQLMQGDEELFQTLMERFSTFDRQRVNQLIRNAKKEHEQNKTPKSARLLFQYLKTLNHSA